MGVLFQKLNKGDAMYTPIILNNSVKVCWIILGIILSVMTLGLVFIFCYMPFFEREEYLNTKMLYKNLIDVSIKLDSSTILHGSESLMVWIVDRVKVIYWANWGAFEVRSEDNKIPYIVTLQILDNNRYYRKSLDIIKDAYYEICVNKS
jgi:hypothetical protein